MVLLWSRKSLLGPAEIAFYVFLVFFKDGGRRVNPKFHFFVSDVNQGNKKGGVGSRFSCVAPGIERLYLDLPRAVKNRECALELGCEGVWNS